MNFTFRALLNRSDEKQTAAEGAINTLDGVFENPNVIRTMVQITKIDRPKQLTTGTPIFSEVNLSSLRAFLRRTETDTTAEFFNRRLRAMMNLVKLQYRQGEISRARAIDRMMHLLECANRKDGYCYQLLKIELRKEREAWTK